MRFILDSNALLLLWAVSTEIRGLIVSEAVVAQDSHLDMVCDYDSCSSEL